MGRDTDRIPERIACLNTPAMPATLISTRGFNCEVWRSGGAIVDGERRELIDFVVKRHRFACSFARARMFKRDHQRLRDALGDIVPSALFVVTRVDGEPNVVVLADACTSWFDLAHPGNEDEARPLLARLPKARAQLARFVRAAQAWAADGRIVDLYGEENLVLDRDRNVRYLDSFGVFFYADTLHAVASADDGAFEVRLDVSLRRLAYLESLVDA